MHTETMLAEDLGKVSSMKSDSWDMACKTILHHKLILGKMLAGYLPEYQGVDAKEIADCYIEEGNGELEKIHGKHQENIV